MVKKRKSSAGGQPSMRLLRVGENIRHAIATVIQRGDIRDEDLHGVTITISEVRPSPDLRQATVYVMPLGGEDKDVIVKALNKNAPYIRGQMGKMLIMKHIPQPIFRIDESFDEAANIEKILRSERVQQDLVKDDDEA